MKVIVRDRREGKTTELIRWMLEGEMRDGAYPVWSRVIVVFDARRVTHTQSMIRQVVGESDMHVPPLLAILENVWSVHDIKRGYGGDFEYAFDDIETIISDALYLPKAPSIVTITGEAV